MPSSRGTSQPRRRTQVSCIADQFFTDSHQVSPSLSSHWIYIPWQFGEYSTWSSSFLHLVTFLFLYSHTRMNALSVQFSSVTQSCPTLCDPVNCNMPGLPVHHHSFIYMKLKISQKLTCLENLETNSQIRSCNIYLFAT